MAVDNDQTRARRLSRLEVFLDVVHAMLFVLMLQYLPEVEGLSWASQPLGLLQVLIDQRDEMLRILVGLGLTLIYWNLSTNLLSPLRGTSGRHTLLVMLQMVFVCLFIYFAISDPRLAGGPSSPALQCVALALSGLFGMLAWSHACDRRLVDESFSEQDQLELGRNNLVAPLTALLNTPLSWVGPGVWTLGWFVLPFLIQPVVNRLLGDVKTKAAP